MLRESMETSAKHHRIDLRSSHITDCCLVELSLRDREGVSIGIGPSTNHAAQCGLHMTEYSEEDIFYFRGKIHGLVVGIARHTIGDKEFDRERWEEQYRSRVVYSSYPYYPSEEARRKDEGGLLLCDWDHETETKYLKEGVELPDDRTGMLVFEDGTVVTTMAPTPTMFMLDEQDTELIEKWSQRYLEIVREAYDYSSGEEIS